jgi:branched-chain amino acid transport system permease protein
LVTVVVNPLDRRTAGATASHHSRQRANLFPGIAVLAVALVPLLFREVIIYNAGVLLIYFVAAIGLHLLVNWTGQVSLAHGSMVGLPAFGVLALSEVHGISPIYLLPVAVAIGAAVGMLVALPTLRARDLQVALLTLVAGIALERFFYTQVWLVGPAGGRAAAIPSLGPLRFTTSRSLYPLLLIIVAAAVVAAWMLMHSKVARGWYWIQANPDAASVFGLPVIVYRIGAYAAGGAFAGLAGGLTVMWVQHLSSNAFPSTLSFTYLLIAVVAGPGFLGGLGLGAWTLVGGTLFASHIFGVDVGKRLETLLAYLGPLVLIDILVRHKAGLNGLGGRMMRRIRAADLSTLRRPLSESTEGDENPSVARRRRRTKVD